MPWQAGTSGNPRGRPKRNEAEKKEIEHFKSRLKQYSVDALETLYHMMTSDKVDSATRYKCAVYILDRTYGKTLTAVEEAEEQDRIVTINIQQVGETYQMSEEDEREIMEAETDMGQAEELFSEWETDEEWGDTIYNPSAV